MFKGKIENFSVGVGAREMLSGGHFAFMVKRQRNKGQPQALAWATEDCSPAGWGLEGKIQKKPRRLKHRGS
jgi:hypothetical protein